MKRDRVALCEKMAAQFQRRKSEDYKEKKKEQQRTCEDDRDWFPTQERYPSFKEVGKDLDRSGVVLKNLVSHLADCKGDGRPPNHRHESRVRSNF